jgi:hypothetical protein
VNQIDVVLGFVVALLQEGLQETNPKLKVDIGKLHYVKP